MKMMLSKHFSRDEMSCKCGCGLCNASDPLIHLLEEIREELGNTPIYVTSGTRCERWNRIQKGVENSQHLYGRAADIKHGTLSPAQVARKIVSAFSEGRLQGLREMILYDDDDFVHVDTRKSSTVKFYRKTKDGFKPF